MEVFINPGEEEKVSSLGYKDRIKFICQNCNKEVIISNKYNFRNLLCKKCNTIKTSQEKYGTNNPAQSSASIEKQKLTKADKKLYLVKDSSTGEYSLSTKVKES